MIEGVGDEFASARAIISYLQSHGSDLDAHLTTAQASRASDPLCIELSPILILNSTSPAVRLLI